MSAELVATAQRHLAGISLEVVSQGAEAIVFTTETHPYLKTKPALVDNKTKFIVKYRPPKPYRHPRLDSQITRSRTASEAKLLQKLLLLGVDAPRLLAMDGTNGIIWMDFVGFTLEDGTVSSLKNWLWLMERRQEAVPEDHAKSIALGAVAEDIMKRVGAMVAQLHLEGIVHGDLTSSNIMLKASKTNEVERPTLIDFGLSSYSGLAEDRAVDLYVLERALTSTHSVYAKEYNGFLVAGYEAAHKLKGKLGAKACTETLRRLEDVRLRGRKRSMLG
ncbi:unnamed protein product [Kuraishia capsulata CBS 1993]|uniref:EKC/KEOPS complex subunit BUD32 n=1 Tax=Kuraishia capsulata CBS 1993 TaxID=1382522 RepID=W6MTM4_9ASCO|nr:uncharacterized protein KUCA_T00005806001 [Kuraishia capsulata CBS 1993]CDK29813.1 unnamed protein product [Kuraishia capsulata CBS 1993]